MKRCESLFAMLQRSSSDQQQRACRRAILRILERVVDENLGTQVRESNITPELARKLRTSRMLLQAQVQYRFRPYRGNVALLLGDEVVEERHEVIEGRTYSEYIGRWRELVPADLFITRTPGDHYSVLKPPHVGGLSELLETMMRSAYPQVP